MNLAPKTLSPLPTQSRILLRRLQSRNNLLLCSEVLQSELQYLKVQACTVSVDIPLGVLFLLSHHSCATPLATRHRICSIPSPGSDHGVLWWAPHWEVHPSSELEGIAPERNVSTTYTWFQFVFEVLSVEWYQVLQNRRHAQLPNERLSGRLQPVRCLRCSPKQWHGLRVTQRAQSWSRCRGRVGRQNSDRFVPELSFQRPKPITAIGEDTFKHLDIDKQEQHSANVMLSTGPNSVLNIFDNRWHAAHLTGGMLEAESRANTMKNVSSPPAALFSNPVDSTKLPPPSSQLGVPPAATGINVPFIHFRTHSQRHARREKVSRALEREVSTLRARIARAEREITVKNERIGQLERQVNESCVVSQTGDVPVQLSMASTLTCNVTLFLSGAQTWITTRAMSSRPSQSVDFQSVGMSKSCQWRQSVPRALLDNTSKARASQDSEASTSCGQVDGAAWVGCDCPRLLSGSARWCILWHES